MVCWFGTMYGVDRKFDILDRNLVVVRVLFRQVR